MKDEKNAAMQHIKLRVLNGDPELSEATLTARAGKRLLLKTFKALSPGTLVQTEVPGANVIGEVVHCAPAGDEFEVWVELQHSLKEGWEPHPTWAGVHAPESVLESLQTLNNRLIEAAAKSGDQPGDEDASRSKEAADVEGGLNLKSHRHRHFIEDLGLSKLAEAVARSSSRLRKIVHAKFGV